MILPPSVLQPLASPSYQGHYQDPLGSWSMSPMSKLSFVLSFSNLIATQQPFALHPLSLSVPSKSLTLAAGSVRCCLVPGGTHT